MGQKLNYGTSQLTPENIQKIVKQKTTKQEIESLFGAPESKINSSLGEMWTYSLVTRTIETKGGILNPISKYEVLSRALTIIFDEKGLVKDLSEVETNPISSVTAD